MALQQGAFVLFCRLPITEDYCLQLAETSAELFMELCDFPQVVHLGSSDLGDVDKYTLEVVLEPFEVLGSVRQLSIKELGVEALNWRLQVRELILQAVLVVFNEFLLFYLAASNVIRMDARGFIEGRNWLG